MSDIKAQTQEAQITPSSINAKKSTHRHINFKLQKIKDLKKILKEARTIKHLTYRGTKIRIISDFSETTSPQLDKEHP